MVGGGHVGAAGHVEDGLVDDREADGCGGDGADADGSGGEDRGTNTGNGACAEGILDARHELEEAGDRGDDADKHADVDDVLHARRGQADDGGDEQDERQQRQEQVGDVLVLLNLDVVLGCHEVLTTSLSALERELDDQAADHDGDDGAHDAHDGSGRERYAAAVGPR